MIGKELAMTNTSWPAAAALSAAVLLSGCASGPFQYSELSGERYFLTKLDTHSVIISRIDGRSTPLAGRVLLEPGLRAIEVQGPPGGSGRSELVTARIEVEPCTKYYLVAVKPNRLSTDFTVRVDFEEPVAGCKVPPAA
jgi:hypothetical protein